MPRPCGRALTPSMPPRNARARRWRPARAGRQATEDAGCHRSRTHRRAGRDIEIIAREVQIANAQAVGAAGSLRISVPRPSQRCQPKIVSAGLDLDLEQRRPALSTGPRRPSSNRRPSTARPSMSKPLSLPGIAMGGPKWGSSASARVSRFAWASPFQPQRLGGRPGPVVPGRARPRRRALDRQTGQQPPIAVERHFGQPFGVVGVAPVRLAFFRFRPCENHQRWPSVTPSPQIGLSPAVHRADPAGRPAGNRAPLQNRNASGPTGRAGAIDPNRRLCRQPPRANRRE